MRFGRRNKNWGFLRRQTKETANILPSGSVAGEERDALLAGENDGMRHDALGEAAQQFQAALDRLHDAAARGRAGALAEEWTGACMDELIAAVDIAQRQNWREILEALVDAGRILQSCEDADAPEEALPFLEESRELLGMMAVDIDAGNLRPGLTDRWRAHYRRALQDLEEHRIPVVDDDEGEERALPDKPPEPFDFPEEAPVAAYASSKELPALDELPPLDSLDNVQTPERPVSPPPEEDALALPDEELLPLNAFGEGEYLHMEMEDDDEPPDAPSGAPAAPASPEQALPHELENLLDGLCAELQTLESKAPGARDAEALFDYIEQLADLAESAETTLAGSLCRHLTTLCQLLTEDEAGWENDRFFEVAYSFCGAYGEAWTLGETATVAAWRQEAAQCADGLSDAVDAKPPAPEDVAGTEPPGDWENEPSLDDYIAAQTMDVEAGPLELQEREQEADLDEPPPENHGVLLDLMPEDAPDADESDDTPAMPDFEEAFSGMAPEEDVDNAAADAAAPPQYVSAVEELLDTAREALLKGDAGEAKVLALRVAEQIAAAEAAKAEALVHDAEERLRKSADAIDHARNDVRLVEQKVSAAEQGVTAGRETLRECEQDAETIRTELDTIEGRIADIDAQIRQLEERRSAEVELRDVQENAWRRQRESAAEAAARLESLTLAEDASRVRLEEARQAVKHLQLRRTDMETAMTRARDSLVAQWSSLADLEKTIRLLTGGESPGVEEDGQLF